MSSAVNPPKLQNSTGFRIVRGRRARTTAKVFGRFIVLDPEICHGQPTFRGTRVLVSDVLDQVARGTSWDDIIGAWRGAVSKEAISEAVRLARDLLLDHAEQSLPTAAGE